MTEWRGSAIENPICAAAFAHEAAEQRIGDVPRPSREQYDVETLEDYRESIAAIDVLAKWLAKPGRRVESMVREPLGYRVILRREDGKLIDVERRRKLPDAIRTACMIGMYP